MVRPGFTFQLTFVLSLALLAAASLTACSQSDRSAAAAVKAVQHPESNPDAPCACADAVIHNGWCPRCNVGYIAGTQITHARLFSTLDPHGHDLERDSFQQCENCRNLFDVDGFCVPCGNGFFRGQTYFTRLTWSLAQGAPLDDSTTTAIACENCRSHLGAAGWCDTCNRGIVGNVAFTSRPPFDSAANEFAILHDAMTKACTCELCACGMVMHRFCPTCNISYEHLAVAPLRPPQPVSTQGS